MPDLQGRAERERGIQQQLAPLFARQSAEVQQARQQQRRVGWEEFTAAVAAGLVPGLAAVYEQSGNVLAEQFNLEGLEGGLQQGAAQWSQAHALDVAQGITTISRERVAAANAAVDLADATGFAERVDRIFGAQRQEIIAASEVTNAVTAGEEDTTDFLWGAIAVAGLLPTIAAAALTANQIADAVGRVLGAVNRGIRTTAGPARRQFGRIQRRAEQRPSGRQMVERFGANTLTNAGQGLRDTGRANTIPLKLWITERDARVCPICQPLHRQPQTLWTRLVVTNPRLPADVKRAVLLSIRRNNGPTAHPNCRCWTETELVPMEPPAIAA